jgi:putative acyl-CoA dehydrogenase
VEFHPAYHQLMRLAMRHGVHAFSWQHEATPARTSRAPR